MLVGDTGSCVGGLRRGRDEVQYYSAVAVARVSAFVCASVLSLSAHRARQRGPVHPVGFVT